MRIHLLGPSGSGTSTLGKKIAEILNIPWFDSDDLFWIKTNPPFSIIRDREERIKLLQEILENNKSWVISGSILKWGDFLRDSFDLVIYKYVEKEVRLERLIKREKIKYGTRIDVGKDMYETHSKFIKWAMDYDDGDIKMRSKISETEWIKEIKCPVLKLEKNECIENEIKYVMEEIKKIS